MVSYTEPSPSHLNSGLQAMGGQSKQGDKCSDSRRDDCRGLFAEGYIWRRGLQEP